MYYLELICCDGCDNAYHEECLGVNADTLPDPWHCPHCASDSESDGEKDKKMSARENSATSSNRMKADENLDSSDSCADAASTSSADVKMPGMIADTTAKPCDKESKSNNLSGQSIEVFHSKYHCPRTFYSHNLPLLLLCRSNPKGKHAN